LRTAREQLRGEFVLRAEPREVRGGRCGSLPRSPRGSCSEYESLGKVEAHTEDLGESTPFERVEGFDQLAKEPLRGRTVAEPDVRKRDALFQREAGILIKMTDSPARPPRRRATAPRRSSRLCSMNAIIPRARPTRPANRPVDEQG